LVVEECGRKWEESFRAIRVANGDMSMPRIVEMVVCVDVMIASWPMPQPKKMKEEEGVSGRVCRRDRKAEARRARAPPPGPVSRPLEREWALE
jgi:hypothetical protein